MRDYVTLSDSGALGELARWLREELFGSTKTNGLVTTVANGLPTFDLYNQHVGMIRAYSNVQKKLIELASQHPEAAEEQAVFSKMTGLN
jgi:hypothetical protein